MYRNIFFANHSYVDFVLFKFSLPILDLILLFWIEKSQLLGTFRGAICFLNNQKQVARKQKNTNIDLERFIGIQVGRYRVLV